MTKRRLDEDSVYITEFMSLYGRADVDRILSDGAYLRSHGWLVKLFISLRT